MVGTYSQRVPERDLRMVRLGAFADQATFSCVVRASGASLVTGPVAAEGEANFFGTMLVPDQARSDPRIDDFWQIIDVVISAEPTVAAVLHGPSAPQN